MKEVISFIKQKLLEEYKDAIELIIVYGSHARGTFDDFPDLDMFVLVAADSRYSGVTSLPWIFRYKNIGIDCWESIWKQQEENVEFIKKKMYLFPISGFLDGEIIYYRDEKTLSRFRKMQDEIKKIISDEKENMKLLVENYKIHDNIYSILNAQRKGDLPNARMGIWGAIINMITALARLNNAYYKLNWGKNVYEAFSLEILPTDFESKVQHIIKSDNLSEVVDILLSLDEEIKVLIEKKASKIIPPEKYEYDIDDWYIGIIEYLNKMRSACKNRDLITLSYVATEQQLMTAELISLLEGTIERGAHYVPFSITKTAYLQHGLPDLSNLVTKGNFDEIVEAVEIFEERLDKYMKEKSSLRNIDDFVDLKNVIESKITSLKHS